MITKRLYAVFDTVANDLVGGVMLDTHDAPVIRLFREMATRDGSKIAVHAKDMQLISLGEINENLEIKPHVQIIITGAKIAQESEAKNIRIVNDRADDLIQHAGA